MGGLNSTHFCDTHVPVEEPSTASIADIVGLFDDLIRRLFVAAISAIAEFDDALLASSYLNGGTSMSM